MTECTVGKVAAVLLAAAACIASAPARAAESQPAAAPAAPAADPGTNRPVVLGNIKVGGLRAGEAVVLTERGAQRVSPAETGGAQCVVAGSGQGG